jgi:predicted membrane channel-forming protein YqfA (hemolysin III family)
MDQQTIIALIVAAITTVLGFLYRYWQPVDPLDDWIEMLFSIIGGIVLAVVFGNLAPFVGFQDPVKLIEWVLVASAAVFSFTKVVYALVKQAFPNSALARVLTLRK